MTDGRDIEMGNGNGDLAGYGARAGATLLDALIVGIVAFAATIVAAAAGAPADTTGYIVIAVVVLASLVYAPVLLCRSGEHNGQTLGKQALFIRVVREDAQPMTASPALLREFVGKGVLGFVPFFTIVDYLLPLSDARSQAIHDKLASTFVVRADAVPDLEPSAPEPFGTQRPKQPAGVGWAPPSTPSTPPTPTPPSAADEPSFGEGFAPPAPATEPPGRGRDDDEVRGPFGSSSSDPR